MIHGLGIDLVDVGRVAKAIHRFGRRFVDKLFTAEERRYCDSRAVPACHYAARFAAKEAFVKALGSPDGLRWQDVEIHRTSTQGVPGIVLHGAAAERVRILGIRRLLLSLTHEEKTAAAVVIAES